MESPKDKFIESLTKDDLLTIIKYGLRNYNSPPDVTVEDIFNCIGLHYMCEI